MADSTQSMRADSKNKPKILVIDSDHGHLEDMSRRLEKEGFRVVVCSVPRGILGRIRSEAPDAVIVEVILPFMSGFDIAARMQADPRLSPIPILFTTDIQDSDGENSDYFSRPFHMPGLVRALKARISTGS